MSRNWKATFVTALVAATTLVMVGTAVAAPATNLPPLNPGALQQAIAGLPNDNATAAIVRVSGSAGHWSGTSGAADLATGSPAQAGDEFRIGSVSKTFVATVVLQLAGEHCIALSRPIQDYLPDLLPANEPPITVAELLNHTSGLGQADGIVQAGDPQWFLAHRLDSYTTAQLLGDVLRQPLIFEPGTRQQYNGVNYLVLAMLIQRVTGRGYAQEIQQRILRPLGLRDTFVPTSDPVFPGPHLHGYYPALTGAGLVDISEQNPSLYGAQGGMISTASDLDKFLSALLGGRLLPPAELADMFTIPAAATGPIRYGMGLLSYTLPNGVVLWGHTGQTPGYVSAMFSTRDLSRRLVFASTLTGQPASSQVLKAELNIASAAYGFAQQ